MRWKKCVSLSGIRDALSLTPRDQGIQPFVPSPQFGRADIKEFYRVLSRVASCVGGGELML